LALLKEIANEEKDPIVFTGMLRFSACAMTVSFHRDLTGVMTGRRRRWTKNGINN
jgi:hypothetical protein